MNKALFAALASVALLGASCSCSAKDLTPVVLDSVSYAKADIGSTLNSASLGATAAASYDLDAVNIWYPFNEFRNWNRVDSRDAFQPYVYVNGVIVYANAYYTGPENSAHFSFSTPTGTISSFEFKSSGQTRDILMYITTDNALGLKPNTTYTFVYDVVSTTASVSGGLFLRNIALFEGGYHTYVPYGYQDYYADGYDDGVMAYEIVKDLASFEFNFYTGSGDDEERHSIVKSDNDAVSYITSYVTNGLVSFRGVVGDLTDGFSDAHDISALFHYSRGKTIDAAPLYIDYEALSDSVAQEFRTHLAVYRQAVQVPWYVFNADLDVGYQGTLSGYPSASLSDRYRGYEYLRINYPMPDVGARLNYIGILSGYAQGYADGASSRDGEVDDLTERILGLEEDLSQYQGKSYQQIYNSGYQVGLDEENQGARTFNSLFGNILTAPLTILNGVSDISFFGMPILTAILSLLMVAIALFLFKRFK